MRLYLHGRSTRSSLRSRLERAHSQKDITSILLSKWNCDDDELMDLTTDMCEYLSTPNSGLEEIILQNCTGKHLATLVAAMVQASPKQLTIRYDQQHSGFPPSICVGLLKGSVSTSLEHLKFSGLTMTSEAVKSLRLSLPHMPKLHSLAIHGKLILQDVDRRGTSIVGRGRKTNPEYDLIVDDMMDLFEDLSCQLRTLELVECHLPDDTLADLLDSCCSNSKTQLQHLNVRGNVCQSETIGVLHDWMVGPRCSLEHLDLTWQRQPTNTEDAAPGDSKARKRSRECNSIPQVTSLAKALKYNTSLKRLQLSENHLTDADVEAFALALGGQGERICNVTLEALDLIGCRISITGMNLLAAAVPNMHLKRLNLHGHQRVKQHLKESDGDIYKKLKDMFFAPLVQNVYLYDLTLPSVRAEPSRSLGWLLEWNRAGRRVLLEEHKSLPPSLWPHLLAKADRVGRLSASYKPEHHAASAVYYMLRERGFASLTGSGTDTEDKENSCSTNTTLVSKAKSVEILSSDAQVFTKKLGHRRIESDTSCSTVASTCTSHTDLTSASRATSSANQLESTNVLLDSTLPLAFQQQFIIQ